MVSPPANWRYIFSVSELTTSEIRTMAEEGRVPSLTPPRIMLWLWQSIKPGVICFPVPSIKSVPGVRLGPITSPIALIRPFVIRMLELVITPDGPQVHIVAFRITMLPGLLSGPR